MGYGQGAYGSGPYGSIVVREADVSIELEEKGKLTVTVLDTGGSALSGVSVAISGGADRSADTGEDGTTVFEDLPVTDYDVEASHPDYFDDTVSVPESAFQ